jgi:DNA polymerase II small subunit
MRKKILERLCSQGILIEPAALRLLTSQKGPMETLERFLASSRQKRLAISVKDLGDFIAREEKSAAMAVPLPPVTTPDEEEPDTEEPQECDEPAADAAITFPVAQTIDRRAAATVSSTSTPSRPSPADRPPDEAQAREPTAGMGQAPAVEAAQPRRSHAGMASRPVAKGYDSDVVVIREITDESRCTGQACDFKSYFEDRLRVLSRILRQRPEMGGAVKIQDALRFDSREARTICMVSEVNRSQDPRTTGTWLTVEDETGTMRVRLPDEGGLAGQHVLKDEVIGVIGKVMRPRGERSDGSRESYLMAQRLVRPELTGPRTPRRSENPLVMACTGDVHVGSKQFLPKPWEKMVAWLKSGEGTAGNVKYLLMPGDLVDGIGVYPNQYEELEIDDIYLQYERFATMLAEIPDHITVIILPGNHDAQRLSEPQPSLPENVRKIIGGRPLYVGNPSYLMVDGVRVLAYHGRGFDDFAGNLGSIGYQQPMLLMREMLKRRHMSPIYGGKNQLAPEHQDHLVINPVPDIFVTGHVHSSGIEDFHGVVMANASTYQAQTDFQRMHNFTPDPGKVPWVRLDTFEFGIEGFA